MTKNTKQIHVTPAAHDDLVGIWDFTAENWSPEAADAYVRDLNATFEKLAANPLHYRERTEFSPPVRICTHKAHVVIYRDEGSRIVVIRIAHGRSNWAGQEGFDE